MISTTRNTLVGFVIDLNMGNGRSLDPVFRDDAIPIQHAVVQVELPQFHKVAATEVDQLC